MESKCGNKLKVFSSKFNQKKSVPFERGPLLTITLPHLAVHSAINLFSTFCCLYLISFNCSQNCTDQTVKSESWNMFTLKGVNIKTIVDYVHGSSAQIRFLKSVLAADPWDFLSPQLRNNLFGLSHRGIAICTCVIGLQPGI